MVYGGMNRKDWRTVSIENVKFNASELNKLLIPTLRVSIEKAYASPDEYGEHLVKVCQKGLSSVLPFSDAERKFLDLLLDWGKINPTFLTSDANLQKRIQAQPLLKWKAINVRRYRGLP